MRQFFLVHFVASLIITGAPMTFADERITLMPMQGGMGVRAVLPIDGQVVTLAIPETLGCKEGLLLNFVEVPGHIHWEGPDQDGAVQCAWSPGGRIHYTARLVPYTDYIDIEFSITNHTLFTWHDVWSFNCVNPTDAPLFQDFDMHRTYISIDGVPRRLKDTTRRDDFQQGRAVYLHEQAPEGEESLWFWNYRGASSDHTDDSWMALLSEPSGYVMAATSVDALFLFNNNTLSCLHSAPNFGDIGHGETSFTVSRIYFMKGDLETLFARIEADGPELQARQAWARPKRDVQKDKGGTNLSQIKEQHAMSTHDIPLKNSPVKLEGITPRTAMPQAGFSEHTLGIQVSLEGMQGQVELRMPETLQSAQGLHFIDHFRDDMLQIAPLEPPVWISNEETGAIHYEAKTDSGLAFGAEALPVKHGVQLKFWVENQSQEPILQINNQMCFVMTGAEGFATRHDLNPIYTWIDGKFTSLSETTPTPETIGRRPWILMRTKDIAPNFRGAMEWPDGWWVVDQLADHKLIARISEDNKHLVGIAWDNPAAMLMTNTNIPCLHAGPNNNHNLEVGERKEWRGMLYLMPNDPEALLTAYWEDRVKWLDTASSSNLVQLKPLINETITFRKSGMPDGHDLSRIALYMQAPWMKGPIELRFPEYLQSSMGFHFLDHHIETIVPLSELHPFPTWKREASGAVYYSFETEEGLLFSGRAEPGDDEVTLSFMVTNNTGKDLEQVDGNMCLHMGGSPEFNQPFNLDTLFAVFEDKLRPLSATTPTPEEVGRQPWLILVTTYGESLFQGPKDTGTTWWRTDQIAQENLMATVSRDGKHLLGYTWDRMPLNLMSNCGNPCLHTGPGAVPALKSGQTHTWNGKIYFLANNPDKLIDRYQHDQAIWAKGSTDAK